MTLSEFSSARNWRQAARDALAAKVKPEESLGRIEAVARQLAEIQETVTPEVRGSRVTVFAGDHGMAAEDVSAYPPVVTRQMMGVFAEGGAAICVLGRSMGVEVEAVDVGVDADLRTLDGIVHAKVRRGTRNLRVEPAMTIEECEAAMSVGREAVRRAAEEDIQALGLGDLGIGNTTAAAALCSALTETPASSTVGPGTGVEGERLIRKRELVQRAVTKATDEGPKTPKALLAHLGGLEIAAIVGAALEAPKHQMAVVADGYISTVGVLAAVRMGSSVRPHCFFAHQSPEPGHAVALAALDADPLLALELRLGEGTGAALALPLLRAAADVLRDMDTFEESGVAGSEGE